MNQKTSSARRSEDTLKNFCKRKKYFGETYYQYNTANLERLAKSAEVPCVQISQRIIDLLVEGNPVHLKYEIDQQ